ncbi:PH domain-containing protein [Kurthia sibirica]|uniref:YokE-like PH domain-containing protein n=1 Tax=Kurthia sibirica TaxID=202750 RepID=A0A2U3AKM7_9BACL|nr:PH domain-containing protein [Kurthia sibirica]PWI25079.1 hypothetical protein DEX24_10065 [Kurthia sibirica]GEK33997.1 hypothetical protein KSI01_15300 [Kurthia sibirica]
MTQNQLYQDRLLEGEVILAEIRGELRSPAAAKGQCNGRLVATTNRLLFFCERDRQHRFDEFAYHKIEAISLKRNFKNELRIIFDTDDELQMVEKLENDELAQYFVELIQSKILENF